MLLRSWVPARGQEVRVSMPLGPVTGAPEPVSAPGTATWDAALAELLVLTRAQSVRLIDVSSGRVLGARVARPVPADPMADAATARLADAAFDAATVDGGFVDLVLVSPRSTVVVAPGPYGSVVAVRLGPGGDVGAARRALAEPRISAALREGHPGAPGLRSTTGPGRVAAVAALPRQRAGSPAPGTGRGVLRALPTPRRPEPSGPDDRQPALASLDAAPIADSPGELAARALGELLPVAAGPAPVVGIPLPRRPGRAGTWAEGVLATAWSHEVAVMQRVLEGLRRLG
jgi:hypothetical protein